MQVEKIKKGDEVNFIRPITNIKTYGTVIDITKDGKYLNIRNSIGDLDFVETSKVKLGGKPYKGFALGGRIANKKFKWIGETFTVKKVEKGKVYTTSGRIFNLDALEKAGVKFEKDPNYKPIIRPLYGEAKELAKDRYYDMLQELKYLKAERKQLFMDMEYEAGLYDREWTDEDANRYGGEFNRLDDAINSLENKTKQLHDRIYNYEEGGDLESFSDNQLMVMNQNVEIEHHHEELEDILEEVTPIPAWVVAKMETATQSLSDITHYLDGQKELMEDEHEQENEDEYEKENEDEDEEEIEVVEPIIVNGGSKTEISKNFTEDAWDNFRGFLKGMEGVDLRDDYTFDYKGEQFEIEPIINSDEKGVSNAIFSIFDGDGEEVGEVAYSREGGNKKFTANSDFFGWNNTKFEDGGFMNNVYADGGGINDDYKGLYNSLRESGKQLSWQEFEPLKRAFIERSLEERFENKKFTNYYLFDILDRQFYERFKDARKELIRLKRLIFNPKLIKKVMRNNNIKASVQEANIIRGASTATKGYNLTENLENGTINTYRIDETDFNKIVADLKKAGFVIERTSEPKRDNWLGGIGNGRIDLKPYYTVKQVMEFYDNYDFEDGGYFDGTIPNVSSYMSTYAKGGMIVTSVKDIPNFTERLKQGRITYRGLGMGKVADDFYKLAGTSGTRIKVDGKEYFITDEEFDTFSRGADGKMQIRFDAPSRRHEDGGFMNDVYDEGGKVENYLEQLLKDEIQEGKEAKIYKANFDGRSFQAQTTQKSFPDGVPVMKTFSNYKTVTIKGKYNIVESENWWYFKIKNTWYAVNRKKYGTPPFDYENGGSLPFMTDPNFGDFQNTGAFANGGGVDKNNDNIITTIKKLYLIHYTDNDKPIISNNEDRLIPNSLSASDSVGWSYWGKNKFEIVLPKGIKILQINNENFWDYGKEIDTPKNRGKAIYKEAKNKNIDVIFLNKIAGQPKEYCILNNNYTYKKFEDGGSLPFMTDPNFGNFQNTGAFAKGGDVSNFFKKTYGNLVEKQGIITTKTDWFNKDGVKVLQYGFDPYRNEESNTLFYYSWDFKDSGMDYDDFRNQLVDFFKKTYNKDVSELKALYVGWNRKEKDTYAYGGHLEAHGLKLGDKIIKTIGNYQKVQNKEGNIVYVDLETGYRNTKEPTPFNNGGKVEKVSSEPRIMIMNKYIDKFGTHYGVNLYLLNVKINESNEKQVQKYIDEGLSPFEIYEKLKK